MFFNENMNSKTQHRVEVEVFWGVQGELPWRVEINIRGMESMSSDEENLIKLQKKFSCTDVTVCCYNKIMRFVWKFPQNTVPNYGRLYTFPSVFCTLAGHLYKIFVLDDI